MADDNGTNRLIERITDEARASADAARAEAEAAAGRIMSELPHMIDTITSEGDAKARRFEDEIMMKNRTDAELESKKYDLAMRHSVIDRAFASALQTLESMSGGTLAEFIKRLIVKEAEGGETIYPSEAHRGVIVGVMDEANVKLRSQGKAPLTLGTVCGLKSGFSLRGIGYVKDCSFEAVLSELKEAEISKVAAILFDVQKEK